MQQNWFQKKRIHYKKGECMKSPDEKNVYIIVEGTAQIFHLHPDGKECVIGLIMPGDCIGLLDIFSDGEQSRFARAMTDVQAILLSVSEVEKVIRSTPELAIQLIRYLAEQLEETYDILEQVAYGKVEERLLFLLKKLANKQGEEGELAPLPAFLTHRDLAGMIGSTRETVTFLLNKFIHDGVILDRNDGLWLRK